MRIFTCKSFKGHYPVGTSALILAPDKMSAKELLEDNLAKIGLPQEVPLIEIIEWEAHSQGCTILNDGNY